MSASLSPLSKPAAHRPAGEVHLAILQAAHALKRERAASGEGASLRELVARGCVGLAAARSTVKNLTRRGQLEVVGTVRVPGRNRPVALYAPTRSIGDVFEDSGRVALSLCLSNWR